MRRLRTFARTFSKRSALSHRMEHSPEDLKGETAARIRRALAQCAELRLRSGSLPIISAIGPAHSGAARSLDPPTYSADVVGLRHIVVFRPGWPSPLLEELCRCPQIPPRCQAKARSWRAGREVASAGLRALALIQALPHAEDCGPEVSLELLNPFERHSQ